MKLLKFRLKKKLRLTLGVYFAYEAWLKPNKIAWKSCVDPSSSL